MKDIVPTVLEVAGLEAPGATYRGKKINPPTGVSMMDALTGKKSIIHAESEAIGYELAGSRAIFRGQYKLVMNLPPKGTGKWELYDLKKDPSEVHDLSLDKPVVVNEMASAYDVYQKANGVIPVPEGYNPILQMGKNAKRAEQ